MSVQLILYPQNYEGIYNVIGNPATEFIVNGTNFNNLNSSPSYTVTTGYVLADSMQNAPPVIPNQWYRWRSYLDSPDLPTNVAGNMVLDWNTASGSSGVYQRMTNLIIGQQYNLTINYIPETDITLVSTLNALIIEGTDATAINSQASGGTQSQPLSLTFTAASISETLFLSINSGGIAYPDTSVTITSISVQPAVSIPTLSDGQVIVDLYEDEDLPLTLSVDEFKNVAEKVQSYSKAFNLPATKRNNRIFDHIFEITRTDDGLIFNPYRRTQCVLKQDGFILFQGYLRMLDITDKNKEISYNVNLYSEVIALADVLKDKTFSDLDFAELDHVYNYSNIRNSWQGILALNNSLLPGSFAGTAGTSVTTVLKYPFVDWTHQFTVDSSTGNPVLPNTESAFRPFIKIKYLLDIIFAGTSFTYSSDFFNTVEFDKLFMDFNWGANEYGAFTLQSANFRQQSDGSSYYFPSTLTPFKLNVTSSGSPGTLWDNSSYRLISDVNNLEVFGQFYLFLENPTISSKGNNVRISKFNSSGQNLEILAENSADIPGYLNNNIKAFTGTFSTVLLNGEYIQAQASSPGGDIRIWTDPTKDSSITFSLNNEEIQVLSLLDEIRGDIGQWEFLKGIITMFNLVTLPDKDNPSNIKIEPYKDIFGNNSGGKELNWTDKIDVSQMKLTPLTDLNKQTIFKFEEDDDDSAFNQYKRIFSGKLYGSKTFPETLNPILDSFNILEGIKEIVATPFAATVIKSLMPDYQQLIVPTIYAMDDNEVTTSYDNLPRIMYSNGVKVLSNMTYEVKPQNGVAGDPAEDQYLQFSHFSTMPITSSTSDFNFGECQLMPNVGPGTLNNLFNNYWLPYYLELYNPDTRIMTIKVNLSPADINTFKFNDTVFIKNRTFRVNKIDYKPNDLATVEFILIP